MDLGIRVMEYPVTGKGLGAVIYWWRFLTAEMSPDFMMSPVYVKGAFTNFPHHKIEIL